MSHVELRDVYVLGRGEVVCSGVLIESSAAADSIYTCNPMNVL